MRQAQILMYLWIQLDGLLYGLGARLHELSPSQLQEGLDLHLPTSLYRRTRGLSRGGLPRPLFQAPPPGPRMLRDPEPPHCTIVVNAGIRGGRRTLLIWSHGDESLTLICSDQRRDGSLYNSRYET